MVAYSTLEQSIYTQVSPLAALGVRVRFLPNHVAEIGDQAGAGWVTVYLESESYARSSLNDASAELMLTYGMDIRTLALRDGNTAAYNILNQLRSLLWGFRPTGAIIPIRFGQFSRQDAVENYWVHRGTFMVTVLAGRSLSSPDPPVLKEDGMNTVVLDTDYDTDLNLPLT